MGFLLFVGGETRAEGERRPKGKERRLRRETTGLLLFVGGETRAGGERRPIGAFTRRVRRSV